MAHGYLSYSPVTGEGPLGPWLYDKLGKLIKKEGKKQSKKLLDGVKDLLKKDKDTTYRNNIGKRFDVTGKKGGENTAKGGGIFGASKEPKGLLAASKGGLVKREDRESALGKNPINSDKKEKNLLGPAGSTGRARKGGGPVDMGGAVSKGLNKDAFFQATTQGIDSSTGEYLSREDRIAKFKQGMLADRAAATGAPPITPDIGADIVAAMAKNTQAIITLVNTTEKQTQSGINIADKQAQAQDTLFSRQKASKEEKGLEEGEDLSGFMTPEKIMKAIKPPKSKDGGDDKKDGKGGGLPGMPLGGGKGLFGKGAKALAPVAKWTAIIGTGILAGISLGTHIWHQNNDRKKANAPKSDRLGNLLDDDGNVLSGPSAPTQEEQFVDNDTGERYDPPLLPVEPAKDPNNNPGYNQGGLVSGGKANLVDDVPINADEGEVVMSNRAGNMFGRDTLMSMNTIAGSTNTPSSGGGYAEGGVVGMSPKLRKMYKLLGEGVIEAQMDNKKDVAELQGLGLKNYFEDKGGFEKMGEGLKGFFEGLGGVFASLFRGSPDTPGGPNGADYLTDGSVEGNKKAILASIKGAGFDDRAASNMLAQIEGESGFKMIKEQSYKNTAAPDIRRAMGDRAKPYSDAQLNELKLDDEKFFNAMYGNDMGNSADEGYKYRGRGFIQLTGKNNYKKVGDMIGEDLVGNPDLMLDPAIAAKATMGYYKSVGANNDNMSTMTGAYNAVYRGNPNRTDLDSKDQKRVATRGARANTFLSQMKSGELTGAAPSPGSSAPPSGGGKIVEYLTGDRSHSNYRADHGGGEYHEHLAFDSQETRDAAAEYMKTKGWSIGSMNDGKHADGSYHYSDQAFDLPFYPNHRLKGFSDDRVGEEKFSAMVRKDLALGGFSGSGVAALPSGSAPPNTVATGPLTAEQKAKMFKKAGMPKMAASVSPTPGPVSATPSSPNTGNPLMVTSAKVASNSSGATTVVNNNYYGSAGGQQNGAPTPNNVAFGIGTSGTGLDMFNPLAIALKT